MISFHKYLVGLWLMVAVVMSTVGTTFLISARVFQLDLVRFSEQTGVTVSTRNFDAWHAQVRQVGALPEGLSQESATAWNGLYDRYLFLAGETPDRIGWTLASTDPVFLAVLLAIFMSGFGALVYMLPAYMSRRSPVTLMEGVFRTIVGFSFGVPTFFLANSLSAFMSSIGILDRFAALFSDPFIVGSVSFFVGLYAADIGDWVLRRTLRQTS